MLGFLYLLIVGTAMPPSLLWPRTRPGALAALASGARRLTGLDRARRFVFFGDRFPEHYKSSDQKVLRYLAIRSYTGMLCTIVVGLPRFGVILAAVLAMRLVQGRLDLQELLTQALLGGVLLFLDVQGIYSLAALDARLARECFGPSERELLRQRIDELATSRAAVRQAVDAEHRRIERDLHDGIQQRLVALAMLLGRARRSRSRNPEQVDALLHQAHQESQEVITELREATWRITRALRKTALVLASSVASAVTGGHDSARSQGRHRCFCEPLAATGASHSDRIHRPWTQPRASRRTGRDHGK
ncbi:sensor histidine kinase [Streptomyces sp. WAC05858]|uniref:sensor histidine kinase n=1 Tax=Streptomyces TaxID=1883 RepID=UPI000F7B8F1B|nr:histidine kinase [Streptomyces sp. WAC05858]RSS46469.1 hypothetical protein EF902_11900 [Streptomyces sp. WAC05858]